MDQLFGGSENCIHAKFELWVYHPYTAMGIFMVQSQFSKWNSNLSFSKWFSLKNIKLEEQLSVKALLILIIFKEFYLVNSCLIFDGSFQVSSDS